MTQIWRSIIIYTQHSSLIDWIDISIDMLCFRQFGNFTRQKLLLHIDGTKIYFPSAVESCQSDRRDVGSSNITQSDHLSDYIGLSEHRYPYYTFGISSLRNKHVRTIESSEYRTFELLAIGLQDLRDIGTPITLLDYRIFGIKTFRTIEPSDYRTLGL